MSTIVNNPKCFFCGDDELITINTSVPDDCVVIKHPENTAHIASIPRDMGLGNSTDRLAAVFCLHCKKLQPDIAPAVTVQPIQQIQLNILLDEICDLLAPISDAVQRRTNYREVQPKIRRLYQALAPNNAIIATFADAVDKQMHPIAKNRGSDEFATIMQYIRTNFGALLINEYRTNQE